MASQIEWRLWIQAQTRISARYLWICRQWPINISSKSLYKMSLTRISLGYSWICRRWQINITSKKLHALSIRRISARSCKLKCKAVRFSSEQNRIVTCKCSLRQFISKWGMMGYHKFWKNPRKRKRITRSINNVYVVIFPLCIGSCRLKKE